MWLVTVRANTDRLMECVIAVFCLNRSNAPFHSETAAFDREGSLLFHILPQWIWASCMRFGGEDNTKTEVRSHSLTVQDIPGNSFKQSTGPPSLAVSQHVVILGGWLQTCSRSRYELSNHTGHRLVSQIAEVDEQKVPYSFRLWILIKLF